MTSRFELMCHALGVQCYGADGRERWKKPYRNHFVAGDGDADVWRGLVAEGFARQTHHGSDLTDGDPCFAVTDAGREAALAGITFKRKWGYGKPVNP